MKIEVSLLDGVKVSASIANHKIISDQKTNDGGSNTAPNPFEYFLSSLAMCVGFYVNSFCKKRNIPTDEIKIIQNDKSIEEDNYYHRSFDIEIKLPDSFPDKYKDALLKTASSCTVKKVIQNNPEFNLKLV
jgi:putative redox protein